MALSPGEQATVKRRTQTARNTSAAVRRAANRQRVSGVTVLQATDQAGHTYTLVLTQSEPGRAYLLVQDQKTREWRCSCFRARWQGVCAHTEAVRLLPDAAHVEAASLLNAPIQHAISADRTHRPAGQKGSARNG